MTVEEMSQKENDLRELFNLRFNRRQVNRESMRIRAVKRYCKGITIRMKS
jgi:ribosomal protein L29